MLKRLVVFAVCLLLLSQTQVFASDKKLEAGQGVPDSIGIEKTLKETFPDFTVSGIKESEIEGLYEVTAGDMIFYFSPKGYLIFGEIWTQDGKNLTADRREAIASEKIKSRLDEIKKVAVRIGNKNAKITVIEVSDPDCSFCRKMAAFFNDKKNDMKDVVRYVIFYPLVQIHPDATRKSKHILCSSNKEQAYKDVLSGALDNKPSPLTKECEKISSPLLDAHSKLTGELGVTGTPAFWILNRDAKKVRHVTGANIPLITETIKGFKEEKAK